MATLFEIGQLPYDIISVQCTVHSGLGSKCTLFQFGIVIIVAKKELLNSNGCKSSSESSPIMMASGSEGKIPNNENEPWEDFVQDASSKLKEEWKQLRSCLTSCKQPLDFVIWWTVWEPKGKC